VRGHWDLASRCSCCWALIAPCLPTETSQPRDTIGTMVLNATTGEPTSLASCGASIECRPDRQLRAGVSAVTLIGAADTHHPSALQENSCLR
jgi:hypothetical protein